MKFQKGLPLVPAGRAAFTFSEVLVSVLVVLLLGAIAFPAYRSVKRHAYKARCIGNMKVIHSGLNGFLTDNNHWPQLPNESEDWEEREYFLWWIEALEPYGAGRDSWLCPSDDVFENSPKGLPEHVSSYVPALFNSHQFTPYRWNQPWLAEKGNFHKKGAHLLMQDGSITTSESPWGDN